MATLTDVIGDWAEGAATVTLSYDSGTDRITNVHVENASTRTINALVSIRGATLPTFTFAPGAVQDFPVTQRALHANQGTDWDLVSFGPQ